MIEQTSAGRHLYLAPLVLRLGLAGVLAYSGYGQIAPASGEETSQSLTADEEGVALLANWDSVIGAGQLAVGALLLVGFWTRWVSLAVLGTLGYGGYVAMSTAGAESVNQMAQLFDSNRGAILLLGAAFLSLLVSGAGCVGLDCRKQRLQAKNDTLTA